MIQEITNDMRFVQHGVSPYGLNRATRRKKMFAPRPTMKLILTPKGLKRVKYTAPIHGQKGYSKGVEMALAAYFDYFDKIKFPKKDKKVKV